jgi:hypothetical protein
MKAVFCFPVIGISGNIRDNSGTCWSFRKSSTILQKVPEKRAKQSVRQQIVIKYQRQVDAAWVALTADQQAAWYHAASSQPVFELEWKCGSSGRNLHRSCNMLRRFGVGDLQTDPPSAPSPNPIKSIDRIVWQPSYPRLVTIVWITSTAARNTRLFFKFGPSVPHDQVPYNSRVMLPARKIDVSTYSAPNLMVNPSSNGWQFPNYSWTIGEYAWVDLSTYSLDMFPMRKFRGIYEVMAV